MDPKALSLVTEVPASDIVAGAVMIGFVLAIWFIMDRRDPMEPRL